MLTAYDLQDPTESLGVSLGLIDRWVTPGGGIAAEFHRCGDGFLIVFPRQAEFHISLSPMAARARALVADAPLDTLFRNAILPLLGNYSGGLALHGSAVATPWGAVAFMGLSRRGKTTLAGAFAKAGHPLLSEDCVALELRGGDYLVQPQGPYLRLFADSAAHLLGETSGHAGGNAKVDITGVSELPVASEPAPLRAIFLLGDGASPDVQVAPLGAAAALANLMPNAFVLDVEDKERLRGHFGRLASLSEAVPCHALDYPRRYEHLPQVIAAVCRTIEQMDRADETE